MPCPSQPFLFTLGNILEDGEMVCRLQALLRSQPSSLLPVQHVLHLQQSCWSPTSVWLFGFSVDRKQNYPELQVANRDLSSSFTCSGGSDSELSERVKQLQTFSVLAKESIGRPGGLLPKFLHSHCGPTPRMQNGSPCPPSCRSQVTAFSQLRQAGGGGGDGKGVAVLFLCQHLGPWPWQVRGLEEVLRVALPSWSNTLCRGNLLQEILEGSLEPGA